MMKTKCSIFSRPGGIEASDVVDNVADNVVAQIKIVNGKMDDAKRL
jgi:hypothetical protein